MKIKIKKIHFVNLQGCIKKKSKLYTPFQTFAFYEASEIKTLKNYFIIFVPQNPKWILLVSDTSILQKLRISVSQTLMSLRLRLKSSGI